MPQESVQAIDFMKRNRLITINFFCAYTSLLYALLFKTWFQAFAVVSKRLLRSAEDTRCCVDLFIAYIHAFGR